MAARTKKSAHFTYVPMKHYPVVIAGYKPRRNLPRDFDDSKIEKFLSDYPGFIYGREISMDNLEEIDVVFMAVVKVIRDLRKIGLSWNLLEDKKKNSAGVKIKKLFRQFMQRLTTSK
jgi:hypothetical protein